MVIFPTSRSLHISFYPPYFISHFEIESYPFKAQHLISDFTPYFTPKIPHLRVHYINQHIPINQIVTKITQMQKTPFLRITAKNNPF